MIQTFTYQPKGTCSVKMVFKIEDTNDTIQDFSVLGGCSGNLQGIRRLILGMNVKEVADKLSGVRCGMKKTSCPDQLAQGLYAYLKTKENHNG